MALGDRKKEASALYTEDSISSVSYGTSYDLACQSQEGSYPRSSTMPRLTNSHSNHLIQDPQTGAYKGGKSLLAYFASQHAHASVCVDEVLLEEAAQALEHIEPAPVLAKEDFVAILQRVSAMGSEISQRGRTER